MCDEDYEGEKCCYEGEKCCPRCGTGVYSREGGLRIQQGGGAAGRQLEG